MKVIDATPPADFPKQVIVMDREVAMRHPTKGFYLRVGQDNGDVDIIELDCEMTLPSAVKAAHQKGYSPSHWMEAAAGFVTLIPTAIRPT